MGWPPGHPTIRALLPRPEHPRTVAPDDRTQSPQTFRSDGSIGRPFCIDVAHGGSVTPQGPVGYSLFMVDASGNRLIV